MARDPYTESRLERWARWLRGGSGILGYAGVNWDAWLEVDDSRGTRPVVPDDEEAITDQAVQSLPPEQQAAIRAEFCEGGSTEKKADRLGCHPQTYRARVQAGMRGVSRWLTDRQRAQEAERARVEALRRASSAQLAERDERARAERAQADALQYAGKAKRKSLHAVRKRGLGSTRGF